MNKTYKAVICSILVGVLVFGLGAFSYAPKSDSDVQGIKEVKISCQPKEIYIKQGTCPPKWSKCTLKIVGADVPALDMELLIDRSKKAWQEIEPEKEEINNFLDKFKNEGIPVKVSLVSLAPQENVVPATDDLEKVKKAIDVMTGSEELPDLGAGINLAIKKLKNGRPKAVKVMVVITAYQGKIARVMIPTWEAEEEDIYVFTVGTNYPNYAALRWIAEKTDARFFKKPSKGNFDSLFQEIAGELKGEVAQDIDIKVTLPDHVNIKDLQNDCQKSDATINCEIDELQNGKVWETTFKVDSHEKKDIEPKVNVEYTNPEGNRVKVEGDKKDIEKVIKVPNHQPEAKFNLQIGEEDLDQFTPHEKVEFIDQSQDCDGEIDKCQWELDRDGKKLSEECNFTHQFEEEDIGEHEICLKVWDDDGGDKPVKTDTHCEEIEIKPILETDHESECFLPENFPPNKGVCKLLVHKNYHEFYTQSHTIDANTDLYGVEVEVDISGDWEVDDPKLPPNCMKKDGTIRCLFKKINRGEKKRISYDIRPPLDIENCTKVTFTGKVSVIDPFLQPGKSFKTKEMKVIKWLPLETAISCWSTTEARLDPTECLKNTELEKEKDMVLITEPQKEQALAWWEKYVKQGIKKVVPGTDNETIDNEDMAHIIKCWKKKIPLTECIQQPIVCPKKEVPESQAETQTSCINTASPADLEKIAGIGSKTATSISEILPIHKWEDLLKVKGIGEKTLELIKKQFNLC